MSDMYRAEVPQYGTLMRLVEQINSDTLESDPGLAASLTRQDDIDRLSLERHGAIRLGTAEELFYMRRMFAVMGMYPVGYYDLSVAGVPVHATAFRPISDDALRKNPFRVFTSLLRLELIEDEALRAEAATILANRRIFTPRALELIDLFEATGNLTGDQAAEFVREALETFRWHSEATVTFDTYKRLHDAHRLVADVVSFKGPHINHLTPRTLDIDAAQQAMPRHGIVPKAVIEGPPRRTCPILLRQTSFKALEEPIVFKQEDGVGEGKHTARFGEIEQRGVALTESGRALYDDLLARARLSAAGKKTTTPYETELASTFAAFPDDWQTLRSRGLAFFRYSVTAAGLTANIRIDATKTTEALINLGYLQFDPIIYEDFLPVSAAGIFQSNLGSDEQRNYAGQANKVEFEIALGATVINELSLYAQAEKASLDRALLQIGAGHLAKAAAV